jgi:hypothetical protein
VGVKSGSHTFVFAYLCAWVVQVVNVDDDTPSLLAVHTPETSRSVEDACAGCRTKLKYFGKPVYNGLMFIGGVDHRRSSAGPPGNILTHVRLLFSVFGEASLRRPLASDNVATQQGFQSRGIHASWKLSDAKFELPFS